MFTARTLIVAVIAGIIGTVANSIAVSQINPDASFVALALSPGRNLVAVSVALLLVPIFGRMGAGGAWIVSLVVLTAVPSLLAKFVFGVGAPWGIVLGVNFVYALAATAFYAVARRA